MKEPNKLMVVAHPDDEIFFGGDELIQEKGWKVICISDRNDATRKKEFETVMKEVGAEHEIWNYRDAWTEHVNRHELETDLRRVLAEREYKKIVTHNLKGEYGHPEHKALSEIMDNMVDKNLYMFDFTIKKLLFFDILKRKLEILELYKSQKPAVIELLDLIAIARTVKVK
ncbi:GlcNAc-PI de-N-acetylase [Fictibacillus enclensis]|uniref:GlcNAc-PI de-N-acetylase n=1 Tax=Fictibacillus enclensis TaxID=1017270 RepID=A0A0V8J8J0_9BACL|nr:PIG-L family deacetylase [Fictibacillus enclensis]KSU83341.1 hypothetical protein AS030_12270 [Fictibacillus enclensis]SCC13928.1 GlcNAc-PI de-N-acetylase [Fictibacillus enclensis]